MFEVFEKKRGEGVCSGMPEAWVVSGRDLGCSVKVVVWRVRWPSLRILGGLWWSFCNGVGVLEVFWKKMGSEGLLWVNSRVSSWFLLLVECTREREVCGSVLDGLFRSSP